jgi:hypothetical protein
MLGRAYSLGFFFGPGFPRAFGAPSNICPNALFVPLAAGPFFLGASVAPGTGVALFSEVSPGGDEVGAVGADC